MTQPVTPWLPGQSPVAGMNYGRLSLPGINDQAPPRPAGASYPPSIGGKWVPPEDVNLDGGPVQPDNITLDEGPGAAPQPAPAGAPIQAGALAPLTGPMRAPSGWRVKNAKGEVVAELPNINTHDYQKTQVQKVGESLLSQAVTPADKESAQRASAYMLSLVGLMPVAEITKRGIAQYDVDQRNDISRDIQRQKNERAKLMGKGGPAGPTRADKFNHQVDLDGAKLVESIVNSEAMQSKLASIHDYETDIDKITDQISAPNALSQRTALMEYMKTLSGKQSTDVERNQIAGAAGIIDKLKNNLALWNPSDATLTQRYIEEFKQNMAVLRNAVAKRKAQIGTEAAQRLSTQPYFAEQDEETRRKLRNYAYGVVTGNYGHEGTTAAKSSAPAATGHVDEDLLK